MIHKNFNLEEYKQGVGKYVPASHTGMMIECLVTVLEHQNHPSGTFLPVKGAIDTQHCLLWTIPSTGFEQDLQRATEFGGYIIAMLIMELETEYHVKELVPKGRGYDIKLTHKARTNEVSDFNILADNLSLEVTARLEVSATLIPSKAKDRLKQKDQQTLKSDSLEQNDAYAIVVEFATPQVITRLRKHDSGRTK